MTIEFRCTSCDKLLRVKDEAGGKKAKCPGCGVMLQIPAAAAAAQPAPEFAMAGQAAVGGAQAASFPGRAGQNPFEAPQVREGASPFAASFGGPRPVVPTKIAMGEMFSLTWAIFKNNWGLLVAAPIAVQLLQLVVQFAAGFVSGFMGAIGGAAVALICGLLVLVGSVVFSIWLTSGLFVLLLRVARGERAELGDLFSGGPHMWPLLGVSLLVGIMVMAGTMLLIVPGIILGLMFFPAMYLVVDQKLGVGEALSTSAAITRGNKMTMFGIYLVAILATPIVVVLTLFIGILFVVPYLWLLAAVTYLCMAGQPVAARQG